MPTVSFRNELIDIANQLTQLATYREELLAANTMTALDSALDYLEQSSDTLKACVASLKYRWWASKVSHGR